MRRATRKFYESEESIKTVKKTVKKVILNRSKGLKILDVIVVLEDDPYDDDDYYYAVKVIYDDTVSCPIKGLAIGLNSAVRDELDKYDLEPYPVFRILPNSEYKELKTEAA
ncbi:MAG: hypothetical protein ACYYKD_10830 [Rhodospirillales bacterium]